MSAALITATLIGLGGLVYSAFLGYSAAASPDVLTHTTVGIFFTLITLLAHSMTMFYLIGKGKAVREAVTEENLSPDLYAVVARARKPVFKIATVAMFLTMTTGIVGGGIDIGVLPAGVHSLLAFIAIVANCMALRSQVAAMTVSSKIVAEINTLLVGNK